MNRRTFAQTLASAAAAAALPPSAGFAGEPHPAPRSNSTLQLSVMLWTVFNELPFEQRLERVSEAGYNNVELVGEYAKWTEQDFTNANAARRRLNIRFDATAGLKHGVADPDAREALAAELTDALRPMETLACPAMILLSGNVIPTLSREQQHASCVESLKRCAAAVEGKEIDGQPVKLLLECIDPEENPKYFLTSAAEGIEIVRQVNHPQVRFLYDMFHEQIGHGNLIEKLEKNIDVIDLIHVADVPGRHDPGTGEINYSNIFRKLADLKYKGMTAMEFKPLGDQVDALRQARLMALGAWA